MEALSAAAATAHTLAMQQQVRAEEEQLRAEGQARQLREHSFSALRMLRFLFLWA